MDKEVRTILKKYLRPGGSLADLQDELLEAHCIIYKSGLSPMNSQPLQFVDAIPDKDYPLRILQVYRQNCDCQWTETTDGGEPANQLLVAMNKQNVKRAEFLDKAIAILQREMRDEALANGERKVGNNG